MALLCREEVEEALNQTRILDDKWKIYILIATLRILCWGKMANVVNHSTTQLKKSDRF